MGLTPILFFLAFGTGLMLALFRHPRFGLYTYLAVFYLDPHSRWWGASLPDLRWSLFAGIVTMIGVARLGASKSQGSWSSTTPGRLLLVFTVWMWIQNMWALAHPEHLEASILFTKYVVLYYLMFRLLDTPTEVRNVLLVHVLGCAYLGWLAVIAPAGGRLEGVGGPGIDEANALGMFAGTGVMTAAMLMLGKNGWPRWISILSAPLIVNMVVQSQSRGAMLGVVAGGLVIFYLRPRAYRWQFYTFAAIGALLLGYIAQDVFWERMSTMRASVDQSQELDSSAESRVVLAKAQLQMARRYPLGAGHRGTAELSTRYLDEKWLTGGAPGSIGARSSHSTLMSALVEQGIPGIVIFAVLFFWLARMIRALKRAAAKIDPKAEVQPVMYGVAAAASLVVVFVAGVFTDYIKTEVQIWMLAVLAVTVLVHLAPSEAAASSPVPKGAKGARFAIGAQHARPRQQL